MSKSLKARLLVGTTVASTIVLGCLGVGLYIGVRQSLLANFDATLRRRAQAIAAITEQRRNEVRFEFERESMPEFGHGRHPAFFEMWLDGRPWRRSPSLGGGDLSLTANGQTKGTTWTRLANGQMGRTFVMTFLPHPDDEGELPAHGRRSVTIAVARDTEELQDELAEEMWIIIGACAVAVVVSGLILVVVVNRAVRPVENVAGQIEQVREGDLSMRVDAGGIPTELAPVVEKLNGLLGRLGRAFERERGFTADVAHELRTPLAGMRATLEVCRSRSRDEAGYSLAIDKSLAMLGAMQGMVENLLLLARAESGQLSIAARDVDVPALMRESWDGGRFAVRAEERGLCVDWEMPASCVARCDPDNLRIVLNNLFDNAVTYADKGGRLGIVAGTTTERTVEISIANSGSEIEPANAGRVFERFWRSDAARADTGVHAGLGLSLCERLARVMGGGVGATSEGGIFTVRVTLPR